MRCVHPDESGSPNIRILRAWASYILCRILAVFLGMGLLPHLFRRQRSYQAQTKNKESGSLP